MKKPILAICALALIAAGDPATETEHRVEAGETLRGIANRAGVSLPVIAAANGLVAPYDVRVGQVLKIPRQRVHTVKRGDTGYAISAKYGVPFDLIAVANGLAKPYNIRVGQRLIIPAVGSETPVVTQQRAHPYFRRPHDGRILYGFTRRASGSGHEGVDIAVNRGDMVRASASGKVVFAARDSGRFGRLVVIDHGKGWRTRYGHLDRITVKLGEYVNSGERIGIGGQGGEATRPELHFDILRNGKPVDPQGLLADRGS